MLLWSFSLRSRSPIINPMASYVLKCAQAPPPPLSLNAQIPLFISKLDGRQHHGGYFCLQICKQPQRPRLFYSYFELDGRLTPPGGGFSLQICNTGEGGGGRRGRLFHYIWYIVRRLRFCSPKVTHEKMDEKSDLLAHVPGVFSRIMGGLRILINSFCLGNHRLWWLTFDG